MKTKQQAAFADKIKTITVGMGAKQLKLKVKPEPEVQLVTCDDCGGQYETKILAEKQTEDGTWQLGLARQVKAPHWRN